MTNLLPGPVAVGEAVGAAFAQPPLPHRGAEFAALMSRVRDRLRQLLVMDDVILMPGSGTLANDAIGAQLAAEGRPGLILSNGEFGERLVDHARRWQLQFDVLRADWGQGFGEDAVREAFARSRPRWAWMAVCETSTGVRNGLELVRSLCRQHGADLCLDAVSAAGLQALDLAGARFVSAVSGKAMGAYPGLAIVAHDGRLVPAGRIPRYLDLAAYREALGVPYTQSSNLLAALDAALAIDWPQRWLSVLQADQHLREGLRRHGFSIVAEDGLAMPGILTLLLPVTVPASRLARRMERRGYLLAHRSSYLALRNWAQICLMGRWDPHALEVLPEVLVTQMQARAAPAEEGHPATEYVAAA